MQNTARTVEVLHLEAMSVQEYAAPANQLDAVAIELREKISVLRGNDGIDTVQQRRQWRIAAQFHGQCGGVAAHAAIAQRLFAQRLAGDGAGKQARAAHLGLALDEIGRASCRERV